MHDSDLYHNESLGFSITKPPGWIFLPTAWAATLRNRAEPDNEELQELRRQAQVPFVNFYLDHGLHDTAYPTVQVTCRPLIDPAGIDQKALLELQIDQLRKVLQKFDLRAASATGLIARYPANMITAAFTVRNASGDEFHCLSRLYTVFTRNTAFTVSMSGPAAGPLRCEDEFSSVLRSVRID